MSELQVFLRIARQQVVTNVKTRVNKNGHFLEGHIFVPKCPIEMLKVVRVPFPTMGKSVDRNLKHP